MNRTALIAKARKILAKRTAKRKTKFKVIVLRHGEKLPEEFAPGVKPFVVQLANLSQPIK
ncbi:hypothetical protein ACFL17_04285 [Pseudomonadota bacterium]